MNKNTDAKDKTRLRFTISYDGTDFCGWQRQNHVGAKPSLCETVQKGLEKVFNQKISLFASGRTDAGVHALNQVCHFDVERAPEKLKGLNLGMAMRSHLPDSIRIKKVWVAPPDFHATLSPEKKTYRYLIHNTPEKSVFLSRYTDWVRKPLDLELLNQCAHNLVGTHDFKSFQSTGSEVAHTVREIFSAQWTWRSKDVAQFSVTGSGFLKQMVRNIVGTQIQIERKGLKADKITEVLAAQDRRAAGPPAPPQGLFLIRVYYPLDLDNRCREL